MLPSTNKTNTPLNPNLTTNTNKKTAPVKVLNELYHDDGQIGYIAREYLDAKLIRPEAIKVIQMTE